MRVLDRIARLFRMSDESWRRHANPWSVYTRFAAIPAMIVAIWSRVWIGWWSLVPIAVVIVWLLINPHIFPPVEASQGWTAKGIYGERLWLQSKRENLPSDTLAALRWFIVPGVFGFVLLAYGLIALSFWPAAIGALLVILAQLGRIDRLGRLYDEMQRRG